MINGSCKPEAKCHQCVELDIIHENNATWDRNKCTKCKCEGKGKSKGNSFVNFPDHPNKK